MTEACFRYAIDGVGTPVLKGQLKNGVVRHMNKRTSDKNPEHTRIGDLQYHHFSFDISNQPTNVEIELSGEKEFDLCLYLKKGAPAFRSNADHAKKTQGSAKVLKAKLPPGKWFLSVECVTTVKAELDGSRGFFNYSGNTAVLNGAAYRIKFSTGN